MMKRGRGGREGRWNDRHKSSCDRREREQMYCLIVKPLNKHVRYLLFRGIPCSEVSSTLMYKYAAKLSFLY